VHPASTSMAAVVRDPPSSAVMREVPHHLAAALLLCGLPWCGSVDLMGLLFHGVLIGRASGSWGDAMVNNVPDLNPSGPTWPGVHGTQVGRNRGCTPPRLTRTTSTLCHSVYQLLLHGYWGSTSYMCIVHQSCIASEAASFCGPQTVVDSKQP